MVEDYGRLSVPTKLGYGVGDLGANIVFTTVNFFLMYFLTDISLLSASLAGLSMMAVRLVDACTDPMIGYLSDRTHTRWGRRRPYILFGSIVAGVFFWLLFTRLDIQSPILKFAYFTFIYLVFFVSYSAVNVPYSALTPDMTRNFNERTNLTGYRMSCAIIGSLVAAGATKMLVGKFPDEATGFSMVALIYGAAFIVFSSIVFFSVKETGSSAAPEDTGSALRLYIGAFRNMPFVLAALTYILHTVAVVIISSTLVYYFKYYICKESHLSTIFLTLLGIAVLCIPVWVTISKKTGKKFAYNTGMVIFAAAIFGIFFVSPGQIAMIYILTGIAGFGFSTFFVLPWAIVPDTIEYNEYMTGQRNEGIFYGIWSFGPKLGSALASLLVGLALSISGYIPNAAVQPDCVLLGIRVVLCIIPVAIILLGVAFMSFYPISRQMYEKIVRETRKER
ncbi:MAG TPA: MFS transporter [Desulfomonilia bacterium]